MNDILQEALLRAKNAEPLKKEQLRLAMQDARLSGSDDSEALAGEVARILAFASVLEGFDGDAVQLEEALSTVSEEKHAVKEGLSREEFLLRTNDQDGQLALVPAVLS